MSQISMLEISKTDYFQLWVLYIYKSDKSMSTAGKHTEAEFKEFEPRLKLKPWLKYGWFHFKLC